MNAITQSPIKYHVPESVFITTVEERQGSELAEDTLCHLRLGITSGTDTVKVSGSISKENPTWDVISLLKAAMIQHAKGDPKATRSIEAAYPGNFMREYQFKLSDELGKTLIAQQELKYGLVNEILLMIADLAPATILYVTNVVTHRNGSTEITGELLGTTRTLQFTGVPTECLLKLTKVLFAFIFGPNMGEGLTEEHLGSVVKYGFDPKILANKESLSVEWDEWLGVTFPTEPSEAIKNVADSFAKSEHENCLTQMVDFMFDKNVTWDPEKQLQRNIAGKAHGGEVQLKLIHTVGNFFVSGYVGARRLRIFKTHATIQIHATGMEHDFDMDKPTKTFVVYEQAAFEEWLIRLADVQGQWAKKNID